MAYEGNSTADIYCQKKPTTCTNYFYQQKNITSSLTKNNINLLRIRVFIFTRPHIYVHPILMVYFQTFEYLFCIFTIRRLQRTLSYLWADIHINPVIVLDFLAYIFERYRFFHAMNVTSLGRNLMFFVQRNRGNLANIYSNRFYRRLN